MSSSEPQGPPSTSISRVDEDLDQPNAIEESTSHVAGVDETPASRAPEGGNEAGPQAKKKREKKDPIIAVRDPGKSLLPFSRVQKILKADKELPMVAKDAAFLISIAAEEFIKRLAEASQRVASREKRATVQYRDMVVRRADEFAFLEEIIPYISAEALGKRKPKALAEKEEAAGSNAAPTLLDQYILKKDIVEERDHPPDIVINEDGTMYTNEIQENT